MPRLEELLRLAGGGAAGRVAYAAGGRGVLRSTGFASRS